MDLQKKAEEICSKLTLEEKCKLCVGKNYWQLDNIDRLSIPSIWISDGPHGLRKEINTGKNVFESKSEPSVCFPTASALACTFDEDILYKMGKSLGEECRSKDVSVILGPGINTKRLPICGRNFEYFSEDPYLSGKLGAAYVRGVQSQGVGACVKHFIANNQEKYRMTVNSIIDERALREIYLKGMEIAIKEGQPWVVMTSYNRVNGYYCSENPILVNEILRKQWGYNDVVVSDWGGVNNFVNSHKSGEDLEMPGYNDDYYKEIEKAVETGELSKDLIDESVIRIIKLILKVEEGKKIPYKFNLQKQLDLAQKISEESMVLLKNEDNILPGNKNQNIAIIGYHAKHPVIGGLGSSEVNPIEIDNAYEVFIQNKCRVTYAKGYSLVEEDNKKLLEEAIQSVKNKDIVYLFVGIPKEEQWEGLDRKSMNLPHNQKKLIQEISKHNKNLVVILQCGVPVEISWSDYCKGILLSHLGGSRGGHATFNILLGYKNPCGKLSETYPISLKDCLAMKYYPSLNAQYRESIFVGYRYYDTAKVKVKYPFGYGLSYTSFKYDNLIIKNEENKIDVTFNLANTGDIDGEEIVQIYISCLSTELFRCNKELKYFKKVSLKSKENKNIEFQLNRDDLTYYNIQTKSFQIEGGYYRIYIASSCEDIRLSQLIYIEGDRIKVPNLKESVPSYYSIGKVSFDIGENEFSKLYGNELPVIKDDTKLFTTNSTINDIERKLSGKFISNVIRKKAESLIGNDKHLELMIGENLEDLPFRIIVMITRGQISRKFIDGFVDFLNGKYIKGIKTMIKEINNLKV